MAKSALSNLYAVLSLDSSAFLDGLGKTRKHTDSFLATFSNVGGAVVMGALGLAATAITAVGVAAWKAGNTMDEAMDTIATATGATGPELEGLRSDFESVFASVPTDAKTAADALGILNSRLDITGPALQNLAAPLLEATRLLGGDITTNAEAFTRVMGDWNLPVEDASTSLDALFVAAQKTGAPLDSLMERVVQYGAPMRNFGFTFKESSALLAKWEAEGVNVEVVMGGMRIAQGKFITQGKDMKTGLWDTVDAIQNAKSSTEGLSIATKIFGAKAAGDMYDTIKAGKFDIDDLVDSMMNADGAIMDTAASTADWGEKWQVFKNKATVALAPIGEKMMEGVGKAMDKAIEIFERPEIQAALSTFTEAIGTFITNTVAKIPVLIDGFFQFISFLQNNQGIVVGVLAALGVAAVVWGVVTAAAAWAVMAPLLPVIAVILLIAAAAYLLYQGWVNNWGGIQEKVAAVWAGLQPVFAALREWLSVAIPAALQWLSNMWTTVLLPALQAVWSFLQTYVFPLLTAVGRVIAAVIGNSIRQWAALIQNILMPGLRSLWEWIDKHIMPTLTKFAQWMSEKVSPAIHGIGSAISSLIGWLNNLASRINSIQLPDWMTPGSPTPWENGLRGVGSALQTLSRSHLPTFQAALDLQTQPITANGLVDFQPRAGVSVETGTGVGGGASSNEQLMEEIRRLLRDLPNEIARSTATAVAKSSKRT